MMTVKAKKTLPIIAALAMFMAVSGAWAKDSFYLENVTDLCKGDHSKCLTYCDYTGKNEADSEKEDGYAKPREEKDVNDSTVTTLGGTCKTTERRLNLATEETLHEVNLAPVEILTMYGTSEYFSLKKSIEVQDKMLEELQKSQGNGVDLTNKIASVQKSKGAAMRRKAEIEAEFAKRIRIDRPVKNPKNQSGDDQERRTVYKEKPPKYEDEYAKLISIVDKILEDYAEFPIMIEDFVNDNKSELTAALLSQGGDYSDPDLIDKYYYSKGKIPACLTVNVLKRGETVAKKVAERIKEPSDPFAFEKNTKKWLNKFGSQYRELTSDCAAYAPAEYKTAYGGSKIGVSDNTYKAFGFCLDKKTVMELEADKTKKMTKQQARIIANKFCCENIVFKFDEGMGVFLPANILKMHYREDNEGVWSTYLPEHYSYCPPTKNKLPGAKLKCDMPFPRHWPTGKACPKDRLDAGKECKPWKVAIAGVNAIGEENDPAAKGLGGAKLDDDESNPTDRKVQNKSCKIGGWSELKLYEARCVVWKNMNCLCDYDKNFYEGSGEYYARLRAGINVPISADETIQWPVYMPGYADDPDWPQRYLGGEGMIHGTVTTGLDHAKKGDIIIIHPDSTEIRLPYVAFVEHSNYTGTGNGKNATLGITVSQANHGKFPDACGNTDRWRTITKKFIYGPDETQHQQCTDPDEVHCRESRHYWTNAVVFTPVYGEDSDKAPFMPGKTCGQVYSEFESRAEEFRQVGQEGLDHKKQLLASANQEKANLEAELKKAKDNSFDANKEFRALVADIEAIDAEIFRLTSGKITDEIRRQIAELNAKRKELVDRQQSEMAQYDEMERKKKELSAGINSKKKEIEALEKEIEGVAKKAEEKKAELNKLANSGCNPPRQLSKAAGGIFSAGGNGSAVPNVPSPNTNAAPSTAVSLVEVKYKLGTGLDTLGDKPERYLNRIEGSSNVHDNVPDEIVDMIEYLKKLGFDTKWINLYFIKDALGNLRRKDWYTPGMNSYLYSCTPGGGGTKDPKTCAADMAKLAVKISGEPTVYKEGCAGEETITCHKNDYDNEGLIKYLLKIGSGMASGDFLNGDNTNNLEMVACAPDAIQNPETCMKPGDIVVMADGAFPVKNVSKYNRAMMYVGDKRYVEALPNVGVATVTALGYDFKVKRLNACSLAGGGGSCGETLAALAMNEVATSDRPYGFCSTTKIDCVGFIEKILRKYNGLPELNEYCAEPPPGKSNYEMVGYVMGGGSYESAAGPFNNVCLGPDSVRRALDGDKNGPCGELRPGDILLDNKSPQLGQTFGHISMFIKYDGSNTIFANATTNGDTSPASSTFIGNYRGLGDRAAIKRYNQCKEQPNTPPVEGWVGSGNINNLKGISQFSRDEFLGNSGEYSTWSGSACSAASLTAVLRAKGDKRKILQVLEVMKAKNIISSDQGLLGDASMLIQVASDLGLVLEKQPYPGDADRAYQWLVGHVSKGHPVIVNVSIISKTKNPRGHFFVVKGLTSDGKISIADSTDGLNDSPDTTGTGDRTMTKEEFMQRWSWLTGYSGVAVVNF